MEVKSLFLVAFWLCSFTLAEEKSAKSVIPCAINSLISEHYSKNSVSQEGKINFVWFGKSGEMPKWIVEFLKASRSTTTIEIWQSELRYKNKNRFKYRLGPSSIVIFDSLKRFKKSASNILWTEEKYRRQHLVYVPLLKTSDIRDSISDGFLIDHVNFLMNVTENSVKLVTGYMFTQKACRRLQFKSINRFDFETLRWENSNFYTNKYKNFYGCELIVADGYIDVIEIERLLRMVFMDSLNANLSTNKLYPEDCEYCDLTLYEQIIVRNEYKDFLVSDPYLYLGFTFAVPPGEPYSDLQKMFMMFDFDLWIAIVTTFIIALCATLTLNLVSRSIRNLIAGRVVSPTLNVFEIFLCGGQVHVPRGSFARILLILFIVWSLIIRTCHQSMLFELLQADLRKPKLKTLDQFFKSNLSLFMFKNSFLLDDCFKEHMAMPSTRFVKKLKFSTSKFY